MKKSLLKRSESGKYMNKIKFIGEHSKYNFKSILPFEIKIKDPNNKEFLHNTRLTSAWDKIIREKIKNIEHLDDVVNITPVIEHLGKWVKGEYFAHEYNAYVNGKARKVDFKDVNEEILYTVYEIKCLDKTLKVMDGYWDEIGGSRVYSGTGDEFTPFEKGLGI